MSCEETQKNFSAYLDGRLTSGAREVVGAHLERCPACRLHLAETRAIVRAFGQLERPQSPAALVASISDALMIERAARKQQPPVPIWLYIFNWVRPRVMPYTIGFENEPSASAPAQVVTVRQQLDPTLDWSTFQLGEVAFGKEIVPEEATIESFYKPGGGIEFFTAGHSPVALEVLAKAGVDATALAGAGAQATRLTDVRECSSARMSPLSARSRSSRARDDLRPRLVKFTASASEVAPRLRRSSGRLILCRT